MSENAGSLVQGTVAPGFESVRVLFERDMRTLAEEHAQLCVYRGGERVVDLWSSAQPDPAFTADSLVNVFSSGKSLEAIAMASLVSRGLLAYDRRVADYWPEFGASGKGEITVADLMRHEGGLAAFRVPIDPDDLVPDKLRENRVGKIVEEHPARFPTNGGRREYHAVTRGWIANELFRRVDPAGRTIGEYLREEVSGPLGADAVIGVREPELERITKVTPLGLAFQFLQSLKPRFLGRKIVHNFFQILGRLLRILPAARHASTRRAPPPFKGMRGIDFFNERSVALGETPSAAAKCSARGLARIAAMMATGGRFDGRDYLSGDAWRALHHDPVGAWMGFRSHLVHPGRGEPLPRRRRRGARARARAQRGPRGLLRLDGPRRLDLPVASGAPDRLRLRADRAPPLRLPERARKGLPGRGAPLRGAARRVSAPGAPKLPKSTLFAYGAADFPVMLASTPMMLYLNIFYASEVGIGLVELANLLLFARIFDLLTDPLVGYLSDHTRTRWGRRKPWMVASVPLLVVGLYKVLIPEEGAGIGYVFGWLMVLWLGWTMLMIPYYAWGAELSGDYDDRTRVTGWRAAMGSAGQLTSITFPVVAALWFDLDGIAGIMRLTAWAAVVLIPVAVFVTVTRVKEEPTLEAPAMRALDGLAIMMRNGSFRWLVVAFMISSLGLAVMMPMNAFYTLSVLEAEQNQLPILMFFGSIAGLLGIPFWVGVSHRYGKHRAWIGGFLMVTAFSPMYLFLGPGDFWLMVPFSAISAFGTGSFVALPNSMKADVIDIDTARTGENRAATFFSAWSLATKLAGSLGGSLGLWALALVGFDAEIGPANPAAAIEGLRYVYVFLPAAIFVLAAVVIWNYPLTRERQQRIRAAIDRRDARRARRLVEARR